MAKVTLQIPQEAFVISRPLLDDIGLVGIVWIGMATGPDPPEAIADVLAELAGCSFGRREGGIAGHGWITFYCRTKRLPRQAREAER